MKPVLLSAYATFCGIGYMAVCVVLSLTLLFLFVSTVTGVARFLDRDRSS